MTLQIGISVSRAVCGIFQSGRQTQSCSQHRLTKTTNFVLLTTCSLIISVTSDMKEIECLSLLHHKDME